MSILFKKVVELHGGYHTVTKVMHDDFYTRLYEDDGMLCVRVFDGWFSLQQALLAHNLSETEVANLMAGEVVEKEGGMFLGLAAYQHGGKVIAPCNSVKAHSWPDQQWDVIPLVGFIHINLEEWGIRTGQDFLDACLSLIEEWNHLEAGEVYGFVVSLFDPAGDELEWDSCWGFIGDLEFVKAEAEATRRLMVEHFMQTNQADQADDTGRE